MVPTLVYINVIIDGKEIKVILDSGASVSVVSHKFIKSLGRVEDLTPSVVKLVGITNDGGVINKGSIKLPIQFPGNPSVTFSHTFLTIPNLGVDVIIGNDFHIRYGSNFDYETNTLWLPAIDITTTMHHWNLKDRLNMVHPYQPFEGQILKDEVEEKCDYDSKTDLEDNQQSSFPNLLTCSTAGSKEDSRSQMNFEGFQIRTTMDIMCPANSECNCITPIMADGLIEHMGQFGLFNPTTQLPIKDDHDNLYIPRQLITISNQMPLSMINLSTKDILLPSGTVIGWILPEAYRMFFIKTVSSENDGHRGEMYKISATDEENLSEQMSIQEQITKILQLYPWMTEIKIGEIADDQKLQIYKVLVNFEDTFSQHSMDLGCTHLMQHHIETTSDEPIVRRSYRLSQVKSEALETQVQELVKIGVLEKSESAWNAPVVMVQKKNGDWRLCIDYRQLNTRIESKVFPLPLLQDFLDQLSGSAWFTSMDLSQGFWQVPLTEKSKHKTAFSSGLGHWQFKRLPMGLKTSPPQFQRLMALALGSMYKTKALVYIDDILLYSATFEEHLEVLRECLTRLRQAGLKLQGKKCHLVHKVLRFLGHVISAAGSIPDPEKTESIINFPTPGNVRELKTFLGVTAYYKRYVPNYSNIARPLHDLTMKNTKFIWSTEANLAFERLKAAMCTPPILRHVDPKKPFLVFSDASQVGVGAILAQMDDDAHDYVVEYYSKALTATERKWCTTDRELYAVILAMEKFKSYLEGRKFTLVVDHAPLVYLASMRDLSDKHHRWLLRLLRFDFDIRYRPGKIHLNCDSLSRLPQYYGSNSEYPAFRNHSINLMPRIDVPEDEITKWKLSISTELKLPVLEDKPRENLYHASCSNSYYSALSEALSHTAENYKMIRQVIHDYEVKHRKYFKDYHIPPTVTDKVHFKGILTGEPATHAEIVATAGILQIPVIISNRILGARDQSEQCWRPELGNHTSFMEHEEVIRPSSSPTLKTSAPNGVVLQFGMDKYRNYHWINTDMKIISKPVPRAMNAGLTKNIRNQLRKGTEDDCHPQDKDWTERVCPTQARTTDEPKECLSKYLYDPQKVQKHVRFQEESTFPIPINMNHILSLVENLYSNHPPAAPPSTIHDVPETHSVANSEHNMSQSECSESGQHKDHTESISAAVNCNIEAHSISNMDQYLNQSQAYESCLNKDNTESTLEVQSMACYDPEFPTVINHQTRENRPNFYQSNLKEPQVEPHTSNATCLSTKDTQMDEVTIQKTTSPTTGTLKTTDICFIGLTQPQTEALTVPTRREIITHQQQDDYCQQWRSYLQDNKAPTFTHHHFEVNKALMHLDEEGMLLFTPRQTMRKVEHAVMPRIVLPLQLINFVFKAVHEHGCHTGVRKGYGLIEQRYFRPSLKKLFTQYVSTCTICYNKKATQRQRKAPLVYQPPPQYALQSVSTDIVGPLNPPSDKSHKYILTIIDLYSRYLVAVPVKDVLAETIAKKLVKHWIMKLGTPRILLSDRGVQYESQLFQALCKYLGITKVRTSAYHPQTNGVIERTHGFINNALKMTVSESGQEWYNLLPYIVMIYNNTIHTALKETPAFVLFSRDLRLPTDIWSKAPIPGQYAIGISPHAYATVNALRLRKASKIYEEAMKAAKTVSHTYENQKRLSPSYKEFDLVVLRTPMSKKGISEKLYRPYSGLYRIIRLTSPVNCEIQEVNGVKSQVVHVDRLKKFDDTLRNQIIHWSQL